jgi:hypothetical protein
MVMGSISVAERAEASEPRLIMVQNFFSELEERVRR